MLQTCAGLLPIDMRRFGSPFAPVKRTAFQAAMEAFAKSWRQV